MPTIAVIYTLAITLLVYKALALPAPTITSPSSNATNHGDPNISCTPTSWTDVAYFFIGNYVAHAATVKSYPGEGGKSMILAILGALLLPTSGLVRGLNGILRHAKFRGVKGFKGGFKSLFATPDYQTAAAAGALIMLVRSSKWEPRSGDVIAGVIPRNRDEMQLRNKRNIRVINSELSSKPGRRNQTVEMAAVEEPEPDTPRALDIYRPSWSLERSKFWYFSDTGSAVVDDRRTIHGAYDLKDFSDQYALAYVPRDAIIVPNSSYSAEREPVLAASYSLPTAIIAVIQLISAIVTLYETTRGAQIDAYGYAAFGLTVIPYATMSLVNLISAMMTPGYSTLFMVGSEVMDEAIGRNACFDGVVGRLEPDNNPDSIIATMSTEDLDTADVAKNPPNEKPPVVTEVINLTSQDESGAQAARTVMKITCRGPKSQTATYSLRASVPTDQKSKSTDTAPYVLIPNCSQFRRSIGDKGFSTDTGYILGGPAFSQWRRNVESTQAFPFGDKLVVSLINGGILFAIIGGLSHFQRGGSTHSQRAWLMTWYVFGFYVGGVIMEFMSMMRENSMMRTQERKPMHFATTTSILTILSYGVPSIGGFVVVAQMIWAYGTCTVKG